MIDVGAVVAGRFRVLRMLGEGGMGAVFEVENTSNGKRFALKTVHPHLMQSAAVLSRFKDEVRASVMVESDHVVNAVDTGIDDATRTPWLLLELLQGGTLEDEIRERGALPSQEARWILEQLGAALVAAHTATPSAVVHLDLKPSNVFLANTRTVSRARVVKVLDFGLARFIDASKSAADLTTQAGTLEWMAPEQFEVGLVRPAADVWAFGLIAFYLLTGRSFWRAANVPRSEYRPSAVLAEVIGRPIPSASARARELSLDIALPSGFDEWLQRCLQREEGDRFKNAVECVPALLALLSTGTSVAPPPEPAAPRGATHVGAPSVPKDLPPVAPASVQRTEVMRNGPPGPSPSPQIPLAAPPPGRRRTALAVLAMSAAPLIGLGVWALTPSSRDAPTTPVQPTGTCPEGMVYLAGGTFTMGASPEEPESSEGEIPQHRVTLSPFCLGRTEVTVAEWTRSGRGSQHADSACNGGRRDRQDHPINCIDWSEADAYCRSLGHRLPTEAEWEFAASVGGRVRYPWGDAPPSNQLCWRGSGPRSGTCAVASFPTGNTPAGISDLSGNVWEFTSDWSGAYERGDQINPVGPGSGDSHSMRGCSWLVGHPGSFRVRTRSALGLSEWSIDVGVRCASRPRSLGPGWTSGG